MRIGLIAMSGVRVKSAELAALGVKPVLPRQEFFTKEIRRLLRGGMS